MLTQEYLILDYLKSGRTITPIEALEKFGCFRLASVIFVLRQQGHSISTLEGHSVRNNRVKHFAVYKLNPNGQPEFNLGDDK